MVAGREVSLAQLLARAGVETADASPAISALTPYLPARRLQPGLALTLREDRQADRLLGLAVEPQPGRIITVIRTPTGWRADEAQPEQHRRLVLARGSIRGVVFEDLRAAGLPDPVARELVRTLAQDVDFQREFSPQDRFSILFERFRTADGRLLRDGRALYAEFHLAGRRLSLWRHETPTGPEWFDAQGRSLRRAFLRTPLDGAEVTSGFGMRSHPVLGFTRMHQGIDFAAPRGTPVFAAADGTVEYVGFAGGYGRTIRLSHAGGTETRYAHLSSTMRGLKPGTRVRQGEVIGKVGSTGLATGPHLHFEISEAGRLVDPAAVQAMPASRLEGQQLEAFQATRRMLDSQLVQLAPMQEVAMAP
ncbi:peptidoglycan DD-metalloendopeptidase family protein [Siccirubricoccus deserti]